MKINVNAKAPSAGSEKDAIFKDATNTSSSETKPNNKDVNIEDVVISNATKELEAKGGVYSIPIAPESGSDQRNVNRGLRHLLLYERRMNRGLFCALGFIVILCILGMATSIGGALFLKFRSHGNESLEMSPLHAHMSAALSHTTNNNNAATDLPPTPPSDLMEDLFRIRVNITLPELSADELAEDIGSYPSSRTTSTTIDPFEEAVWSEIRERAGLGDSARQDPSETDLLKANTITSTPSPKDEDDEWNRKFVPVSRHRALQEPPSFSEIFTFIRKTLKIPTIKIVHDHDSK